MQVEALAIQPLCMHSNSEHSLSLWIQSSRTPAFILQLHSTRSQSDYINFLLSTVLVGLQLIFTLHTAQTFRLLRRLFKVQLAVVFDQKTHFAAMLATGRPTGQQCLHQVHAVEFYHKRNGDNSSRRAQNHRPNKPVAVCFRCRRDVNWWLPLHCSEMNNIIVINIFSFVMH